MVKAVLVALVLLLASMGLAACGDDGPSIFSCTFEQRKTSCGSSSFGEWEAECRTIDFELRDGLSPEQFCQNAYSGSDTECGGGCCLDFQFRATEMRSGRCP